MASQGGDGDWHLVREESGESLALSLDGEKEANHRVVERKNLIGIVNLVVKGLIEASMRQGKTLNDDHPQLQQCLIAMEHVMKHRLKTKRTMLGQKKSFWGVIESFERSSTDLYESVSSVRSIPGVKTAVGRGRAWLRFGMMQKKLADHFRVLTESKAKLSDWYESDALLLSEDGQVLAGLLMGLNAIDYNMLLKGEEFDKSVGPLDLAQFLRDGNYGMVQQKQSEEEAESELSQLLDQKAYLEELNRKLESSVEKLQSKLSSAESANSSLTEQVSEQGAELSRLQQERDELREMTEKSSAELRRALENLQDDQRAELETHIQTKSGLNELYSATQRNLDTESKRRQQLQQELDLQKSVRAEKEMAMQLLEKSIHEKQDTIVGLRKQLQEMKTANLKMSSQIKTSQDTHQKDSLKIRGLENKLSQTTANLKQAEKELQEVRAALTESERTSRELGQRLQEVQLARGSAEQDLAIEKQWRASLQMEIQREKDRVVELTNECKKVKALKKEHTELKEKYACLQETISEQEIALVEMGKQLSLSQQKLSDMKQVSTIMKESVWVDDKNINECQLCNKPFSVARRKHHCRNCGGIFCNTCSENSLQLASSSKPVRVCDSCYSMLLERSST